MVEIDFEPPAAVEDSPEVPEVTPAEPLKGLIVLGSGDADACSDGNCF
ncbi:hypothetical protein [Actinoplanes sp. TFC3]|nr:hypothetical protein [Actinoplanes sp. TFC3]